MRGGCIDLAKKQPQGGANAAVLGRRVPFGAAKMSPSLRVSRAAISHSTFVATGPTWKQQIRHRGESVVRASRPTRRSKLSFFFLTN